jgi:hypothetical protein
MRLFEYTKYRTLEERIWLAAFWIGILLFIIWVEIVLAIAVARLLLGHS